MLNNFAEHIEILPGSLKMRRKGVKISKNLPIEQTHHQYLPGALKQWKKDF